VNHNHQATVSNTVFSRLSHLEKFYLYDNTIETKLDEAFDGPSAKYSVSE